MVAPLEDISKIPIWEHFIALAGGTFVCVTSGNSYGPVAFSLDLLLAM